MGHGHRRCGDRDGLPKARSRYWPARINNFNGADSGDQAQIRHSKCLNGHLILREGDPESDYYALIVGRVPHFCLAGWIRGLCAKSGGEARMTDRPPGGWPKMPYGDSRSSAAKLVAAGRPATCPVPAGRGISDRVHPSAGSPACSPTSVSTDYSETLGLGQPPRDSLSLQ